MDENAAQWWLAGALLLSLLAVAVRWLGHFGRVVQAERAAELFRLQHERFEEALLKAAAATGKPRGLRWVSCLIDGNALLVRERPGGAIVALVPVTVQFEPIEGSDMEDVPAAREPRPATALFAYARGEWQDMGRVVFNLNPRQTAEQSGTRFEVLEHH